MREALPAVAGTHDEQLTTPHLQRGATWLLQIMAARTRLAESIDINPTRLWRAHVTPADWRRPEVTAFVEAGNATAAVTESDQTSETIKYFLPYGRTASRCPERI